MLIFLSWLLISDSWEGGCFNCKKLVIYWNCLDETNFLQCVRTGMDWKEFILSKYFILKKHVYMISIFVFYTKIYFPWIFKNNCYMCSFMVFIGRTTDTFSVYYSNYFWIGGEMHKEDIKKERDAWLNNFDFIFFRFWNMNPVNAQNGVLSPFCHSIWSLLFYTWLWSVGIHWSMKLLPQKCLAS